MRPVINILEALNGTMTLYRGDGLPIDKFEVSKTDSGALFGRGLYLTNNRDVAHDYTINKSNDEVVSNRREEYTSQRDAIAGYLMDLLNNELGWAEHAEDVKTKWLRGLYTDEMRAMRYGSPEHKAESDRIQALYHDDLVVEYRKMLQKAKTLYKQRSAGFRAVKDTQGRWSLVRKGRSGMVTSFEIPIAYTERTLHGDRPLDPKSFDVVRAYIMKLRPHGTDMRDHENNSIRNFDEWVEKFKTTGASYAWRDTIMGAKGVNPSLDEIWNGTHGGYGLFYSEQDSFIPFMQEAGYVGIEYDGGVRVKVQGKTDSLRGGGGIRHQSFVFWDVDYIDSCRVESTGVVDPEVDPTMPQRIKAASLYSRHRLPDKY